MLILSTFFSLQCNEAYSSSDTLLTEGFGGTTVLTCRLQELNALTLNRRKRESNETVSDDQVAGNSTEQDTNSTTTTTPKSTTTTTPKPVSTHPCLDILGHIFALIQFFWY